MLNLKSSKMFSNSPDSFYTTVMTSVGLPRQPIKVVGATASVPTDTYGVLNFFGAVYGAVPVNTYMYTVTLYFDVLLYDV